MRRVCYYVSLKSLEKMKESPLDEVPQPNKFGKKVTIGAMVVLIASVREHGSLQPELIGLVVLVALDPV